MVKFLAEIKFYSTYKYISIRLFKLYHYVASGVSIYDIWNLSTQAVASLNFYAVNFYIFGYKFFANFDLTFPDFQYSLLMEAFACADTM